MKRQDKYPNTDTFYFYNVNPKNRLLSGDCVFRAVSTGLNQSWEQTIREMTEVGIKYGYPANDKHTIDKYLKQKGWTKCGQPKYPNGRKYTGKEFCELCKRAGEDTIIANIGGHHIVAIIDGQVYDTWDSTDGCIGNYWVPYKR